MPQAHASRKRPGNISTFINEAARGKPRRDPQTVDAAPGSPAKSAGDDDWTRTGTTGWSEWLRAPSSFHQRRVTP